MQEKPGHRDAAANSGNMGTNSELLDPEHSKPENQKTCTVGNLEIVEVNVDLGSVSSQPVLFYVIPFFP